MAFYFIDEKRVELTSLGYDDFDEIVAKFGYRKSKNPDLHNYFNWSGLMHWRFKYDLYNSSELTQLFRNSEMWDASNAFILRLQKQHPLIRIGATYLVEILDDLNYESGMGWEAISESGKYIIEFTDNFEHLAITNFEILTNKKG